MRVSQEHLGAGLRCLEIDILAELGTPELGSWALCWWALETQGASLCMRCWELEAILVRTASILRLFWVPLPSRCPCLDSPWWSKELNFLS